MNKRSFSLSAERLIPHHSEDEHAILQRQIVLHKWVTQFARDRVVLDAGCGEGYGSALLADLAKKVVAIDYDTSIIKHAKEKYRKHNLEFLIMDVQKLSFPQDLFDVVVSLDVIEHLKEFDQYLSEIKRVLKPGGLLIISTPNKKMRPAGRWRPTYKFHFREFTAQELKELLKDWFDEVSLWGLGGSKRAQGQEKQRLGFRACFYEWLIHYIHIMDIVNLRKRLLPSVFKEKLGLFIRGKSEVLKRRQKGYIDPLTITSNDFFVTKENMDASFSLIALCKKLTNFI